MSGALAASIGEIAEAPIRPEGRRRRAALTFRRHGARTFLARQLSPHPFHITRPFYLPGDPAGMATLYLQSSSGGLYGDDDLLLEIALEPDARAHVTTQASTIVHAGRGGTTRQRVSLDCAAGSFLELLPDPVILFAGAQLDASLEARLGRGARLVLADSFLAHDPAGAAQPFAHYGNEIVVRREGLPDPVMVERIRLSDGAAGDFGASCHGSLCVVSDEPVDPLAAAIEAALTGSGSGDACYAGVSALPERGLVFSRFLCRDGASLSAALAAAWRGARLGLAGRPPPSRRK